MLMEVYLSEEKAKKYGIDINECYQKIDHYFLKHGVRISVILGIHQIVQNIEKMF